MTISLCRTSLFSVFFLSVFLLCMGMGGKPLGPEDMATITKVSVSDREVVSKDRPIIVSFSDNMVATNGLDKPVKTENMPFSVTPAVEGEGRWITEKSFAFTPTKGYPRGKQYFVLFKEDLRSLDGKPVRYYFSFSSESVNVRGVWPRVYAEERQEIPLIISMTMPVTAKSLREHLSIKDANTDETLQYDLQDMDREATDHEVIIKSGQYRAKISIIIAEDTAKDKDPLGFSKAYSASVNVTAPLARQSTPQTTEATSTARSSEPSPISLYSPYSGESGSGMYAYFPMSQSLATDQDYKKYIEVSPSGLEYSLDYGGSYLTFRQDIKPGMQITVKLLPGLVDEHGRVLKEARSTSLSVQDRYPNIRFAENGSYLTPVYGSRVALSMVNVDQASVTLYRQYDNNLPFMSLSGGYDGDALARSLVHKEIELNTEKNEEVRRSIDLESLAKGQRGVFILNVDGYVKVNRNDGSHYYSHRTSDRRVVVISDIGITGRVFPSGATVFASSISTGKPMPNAQVRIYSASNQLLAEGKTDASGLFQMQRGAPWDPQLRPNVVTVNTGSDISFLPFDWQTSISLPDPASRDYLGKGYEAFLYTPRGVFRPGETVDIKAFVRDANHGTPTPFPVAFSIVSSRGLEVARGSTKLSREGGAEYSFALPTSAPTGEYTATLSIPGQDKERLGLVRFSVEDFVPPRLEVEVKPEADKIVGNEPLKVLLSGQYLFGAPGADLSYELGYRVSPRMFSPAGWEGYVFGDMEKSFSSSFDLRYITGALEADGTVEAAFKSPGWQPASIAGVQLVGSVQEDGGRWVTQTANYTYYPTSYLLGMKIESDLAPGKKGAILVAAVDPEGKAANPGTLSVEISEIQGNWHTVYRDGRYVYSWSERFLRLPDITATVKTSDGKGNISFTPPKNGRFLVRVASEDGSVVASRRISAWESDGYHSEEGTGRMDMVELSFDKKEYLPGETAKLSVKAPYAGTLLLGVERSEQLSVRVVPMPQPSTIVEIPVTRDMDPNVTVTAWVYRPVQPENKEWYAHRAYGSIALLMSKAPHALAVSAETPDRAEPSKGLTIPFSVADADGNPVSGEFSVALVDEGILSLTGFKTPDPLEFFMAQRRSVGSSYDGYDALLRPEAKATPLLIAGGDSAPEDYQGSLTTQQIFLAGFLPTVRTNADGTGEAFFDIPEYSGKGRLMIVGASGSAFASGASQVRFARDVVVEAAAPRAVAPGDSFDITLKAFAMEGNLDGNAEITVEADGPLRLSGEQKVQVPLKAADGAKGPKTHSFTVNAMAENASGIATISVQVQVPGREDLAFTKYLEVAVRPPYPRTSQSQAVIIKSGDKQTLSFKDKWVKDTVKTSLSVTSSPVFSVLPALEYLREYPYGCLEQTVSRAWPYLTLHEMHQALYPDEDAESNLNNAEEVLGSIVARIASLQTSDGGFGMWPGYTHAHSWKSAHAAFFLVEAKARVPIPASTLNRSLDYMRFLLAAPVSYYGSKRYAYTTKAYAAFVLTRAGEAPLAWMQHLSGEQANMWPSGRIFLAAAKALKAGNPTALRELKDADIKLDTAKLGYNESLESTLRNQALLLMAWSLVAPEDPETNRLCVALAKTITDTRWLTTQDAGMASMAFGYYLGKTKMQDKPHTAVITAAGKKIGEVLKGEPLLLGYSRMPLTADGNPEPVTVKVGGEGQAYVVYNARGVSFEPPAAAANNMDLVWSWRGPDGSLIDTSKGDVTLKRGDRITMEVQVRSKVSLSDVVLSVLLPGGLEVENPRLKTSGAEPGSQPYEQDRHEGYEGDDADYDEHDGEDEDYQYNDYRYGSGMFMDLREDRLLLFFDRMYGGGGWTTYSFTMRAVSKGSFMIPPVAAEGMYNPETNATTLSGKVVIE